MDIEAYYKEFQYYGVLQELMDEWAVNHAEHCTWDTPCRSQWCGWDLPKSLQALPPEILNQLMEGCGRNPRID